MSRPKRGSSGGYIIEWTRDKRRFKILTKNVRGRRVTPLFGLGNAVLRLDIDNLPNSVLKKITGESENTHMVPISTLGLRRWDIGIGGVVSRSVSISGFRGTRANITFSEASEFTLSHYENDSVVYVNGIPDSLDYGLIPPFIDGEDTVITASQISADVNRSGYLPSCYDCPIVGISGGRPFVHGAPGRLGNISLHIENNIDGLDADDNVRAVEASGVGYDLSLKISELLYVAAFRYDDGSVRFLNIGGHIVDDQRFSGGDIARITRHDIYFIPEHGIGYKAGPGDSVVMPYISNGYSDFILTVFECLRGDAIVYKANSGVFIRFPSGAEARVPDGKKVVGAVTADAGEFYITEDQNGLRYAVNVLTGNVEYSGVEIGNAYIMLGRRRKVFVGSNDGSHPFANTKSPQLDWNWEFYPASWAGYGSTGYVVGSGSKGTWVCNSPIDCAASFGDYIYVVSDNGSGQTTTFYDKDGKAVKKISGRGIGLLEKAYSTCGDIVPVVEDNPRYFLCGGPGAYSMNFKDDPRAYYDKETAYSLFEAT